MSSDSDSSFTDDKIDFSIEDLLREVTIQPFRFEPICSDSDSDSDSGHEGREGSSQAAGTDAMDWRKCGKCEFSTTINEEICCQNPLVLEKEVFAGEECVTAADAFISV